MAAFLLILFFSPPCFGQSNLGNTIISEFYELLPQLNHHDKNKVSIYKFSLKGKKILQDSSLVARLSIIQDSETYALTSYDTTDLKVIQSEKVDGTWVPTRLILLNDKNQMVESSVVNKEMEVLSKIFYKYNSDRLISEEAYTGYAYLDQPRRLSLISYKYEGDKLVERDKKYSLNGTHWIQTWVSKYDQAGNKIWAQETIDDETIVYENEYDNNRLIKSYITTNQGKPSIKEVKYNTSGYPTSVFVYTEKTKKPLRLVKFYYH